MPVETSPTEAITLPVPMSTLEQLPVELLWMIIDYLFDHHTVFDLRLASKTLLTRICEYARSGMIFPIIDKVIFSGVFIESINEPFLKIDILVARCNSRRFERRLPLLSAPFDLSARLQRYNIFSAKDIHYEFICNVDEDDAAILAFLRDCLGRGIGVAKFADCEERGKMAAVSVILGGVKIDLLQVVVDAVSDHVADHLLDTITRNNVDRLSLWATRIDSTKPVRILVNLAAAVRFIHLFQRNDWDLKAAERNYFLGLRNVDWSTIFREMFSKKLDKLFIENRFYHRYLDRDVADDLIETLPQLGKTIWFKSICSCYSKSFHFDAHGHTVQERTPRELIWEIISFAPDTMFKLRATSSIVKSSVDAYALSASKVSQLTLSFRPPVRNRPSPMVVELTVLKKLRFVAALCLQIFQTDQIRKYITLEKNYEFGPESAAFVIRDGGSSSESYVQRILLDVCQPPYDERLIAFLRNCSGHKIGKVNLTFCGDRVKEAEAVTKILEEKEIGRLCFRSALSDVDINMIKQIGELHRLDITVNGRQKADAVSNLLELCSLVRSLKLQSAKYFCGFEFADWVPIIQDMFSKKVDKVHLSNILPLYLNAQGANQLKERLPLIDKKIWFKADFGDGLVRNERYEMNGNVVQVEVRTNDHPILSIIHSTRVDEDF